MKEEEDIRRIKQLLWDDVRKHYNTRNCYGCKHWIPCEDIDTCELRRNLSCFDNLEEICAECEDYEER